MSPLLEEMPGRAEATRANDVRPYGETGILHIYGFRFVILL